jgi:hypothetical protein
LNPFFSLAAAAAENIGIKKLKKLDKGFITTRFTQYVFSLQVNYFCVFLRQGDESKFVTARQEESQKQEPV